MFLKNSKLLQVNARSIHSNATYRTDNKSVELRGEFLESTSSDVPTMLWFPDLVDNATNFKEFFTRSDNKIRKYRNVWMLNYRNFGNSDHHESFDMHDISDDIIRFMDKNNITMATIGGHGFGAKVATATATANMNRFTGVVCLEGGPVDQTYHEAYTELKGYVSSFQSRSKLSAKSMLRIKT